MKTAINAIETFVENVESRKDWFTSFILILVVLFIGAGSLYMLVNTEG